MVTFFVIFCLNFLVQYLQCAGQVKNPKAPCTQWSRQTVAGQYLIGWGLPSLRRAVTVQWDAMISPTVGFSPWRPTLHQSILELKPVTAKSRVLLSMTATLKCPLQG